MHTSYDGEQGGFQRNKSSLKNYKYQVTLCCMSISSMCPHQFRLHKAEAEFSAVHFIKESAELLLSEPALKII